MRASDRHDITTLADRKRETLQQPDQHDSRVSPWSGTAQGVLQAVNTYEHHEGAVRGDRVERNNLKTINGDFGQLDRRASFSRVDLAPLMLWLSFYELS